MESVFESWLTSFLEFLPRIIAALVIFIVTLIGSGFVAKWARRISEKRISSKEMLQLISRIVRWTVLLIGSIAALDQVNFDVTGFIAGLGVAGFTIGFALQDIAKNFISGLLLLYRQPFNIGERVLISDYEGTVKEINVRDTVLESFDGELVIIPNRDVFENPILNYSHSRFRRRNVSIGLGYEEDSDRAIQIFLDVLRSAPGVADSPAPTVRAEDLGESALTLSALFWVDQQAHDLFLIHSNVIQALMRAAEEHQINLPYPVQTIRLEKMD